MAESRGGPPHLDSLPDRGAMVTISLPVSRIPSSSRIARKLRGKRPEVGPLQPNSLAIH